MSIDAGLNQPNDPSSSAPAPPKQNAWTIPNAVSIMLRFTNSSGSPCYIMANAIAGLDEQVVLQHDASDNSDIQIPLTMVYLVNCNVGLAIRESGLEVMTMIHKAYAGIHDQMKRAQLANPGLALPGGISGMSR